MSKEILPGSQPTTQINPEQLVPPGRGLWGLLLPQKRLEAQFENHAAIPPYYVIPSLANPTFLEYLLCAGCW